MGIKIQDSLTTIVISKNDISGLTKSLNSFSSLGNQLPCVVLVLSEFEDNQIDVIKKLCINFSFQIYQIPSNGPYDAMNFGLSKVHTKYVNFLNGGDSFSENSALFELLNLMDDAVIGYGQIQISNNISGKYKIYSFRKYSKFLHRLGIKYIPHPATIVAVQPALDQGGFDLNYPIAADQKMALMLTTIYKPVVLPKLIAKFERGGISSRSAFDVVLDFQRISREVFGFFGKNYLVDSMVWKLNYLFRQIYTFTSKH
jgi:hypothetical protein